MHVVHACVQGDGADCADCEVCALRAPEGYVHAEGAMMSTAPYLVCGNVHVCAAFAVFGAP
jgi:Pyruvate/2-oxoacid:ferredoxin oxidoreductase delta subunit